MKDAKSKWLIGCGIGCGVLILLFIFGGVGVYQYFRTMFVDFEHAGESQTELLEAYGDVAEFTPRADGTIPAERIEAFLRVRDAQGDVRGALAARFKELKKIDEEDDESFRVVFSAVKSGLGFGKLIGTLMKRRNEALLDQNMGLGEYIYIYVISYNAWLQKKMAIGFEVEEENHSHDPEVSGQVRLLLKTMLDMLRNQLSAIEISGDPAGLKVPLEAEIAAMEADRYRIPWQDGVPDPILLSLEPFGAQLEEVYDPFAGILDLVVDEKDKKGGFFHIKMD